MANEYLMIASEIRIDSTNDTIQFRESGTLRSATLTHGIYFLYGNGTETGTAADGTDSGDFTANVIAAFDAAAASTTYTGETYFWVDSTHICTQFQLIPSAGTLQVLTSGTFPMGVLGFSTDSAVAAVVNSDISASASWMCDQPYVTILNFERDHSYSQRFSSGGKPYSYALKESAVNITLPFRNVSKRRTSFQWDETNQNDAFETLYDTIRKGGYLRVYVINTTGTGYSTDVNSLRTQGVLNLDKTPNFNPKFVQNNASLFDFDITIREVASI